MEVVLSYCQHYRQIHILSIHTVRGKPANVIVHASNGFHLLLRTPLKPSFQRETFTWRTSVVCPVLSQRARAGCGLTLTRLISPFFESTPYIGTNLDIGK